VSLFLIFNICSRDYLVVRGHHVSIAHLKQCFVDTLIKSIMAVYRIEVIVGAKRVVYSVAACLFIYNLYMKSLFGIAS